MKISIRQLVVVLVSFTIAMPLSASAFNCTPWQNCWWDGYGDLATEGGAEDFSYGASDYLWIANNGGTWNGTMSIYVWEDGSTGNSNDWTQDPVAYSNTATSTAPASHTFDGTWLLYGNVEAEFDTPWLKFYNMQDESSYSWF